jgi:hypothetical protein
LADRFSIEKPSKISLIIFADGYEIRNFSASGLCFYKKTTLQTVAGLSTEFDSIIDLSPLFMADYLLVLCVALLNFPALSPSRANLYMKSVSSGTDTPFLAFFAW